MQQVDRVGWAEPGGLGVWVRVGLAVVGVPAVWPKFGRARRNLSGRVLLAQFNM